MRVNHKKTQGSPFPPSIIRPPGSMEFSREVGAQSPAHICNSVKPARGRTAACAAWPQRPHSGQRFHAWHPPPAKHPLPLSVALATERTHGSPWQAGNGWHCMQNQCPPAPNAGPYEPVNSLARPCRPPCGEDCHRGGVQGKPFVWPGN